MVRGFVREPRADARARRNSQQHASNSPSSVDPNEVIYVNPAGYWAIRLVADHGLINNNGSLDLEFQGSIGADADGIKLNFGDSLEENTNILDVKVQGVLDIDGSGVKLVYGNSLEENSDILDVKTQGVLDIDSSGLFVNIGDGLSNQSTALTLAAEHGDLYTHTPFTVTVSAINTWYSLTGITTVGPNQGVTVDATDTYKLVVATSGTYQVCWNASMQGAAVSEYHIGVTVNGASPSPSTHSHTQTTGDIVALSGSFLLELSAGDKVWIQVEDQINPAQNIDVEQAAWHLVFIAP